MPELPEVENVVLALRRHVRKSRIIEVDIDPSGYKLLGSTSPALLEESLVGHKIEAITRRGKYIHISLSGLSHDLVVHLRMTGKFLYEAAVNPHSIAIPHIITTKQPDTNAEGMAKASDRSEPHSSRKPDQLRFRRLSLKLDDGTLHFLDMRRFATFHLVDDVDRYPGITSLGPDALADHFSPEYLGRVLSGKIKPIYSALLDQKIVAGLGNIYVCEVLALSRIHPLKESGKLGVNEYTAIVSNTKKVLQAAIAAKGTTFRDYAGADGNKGNFSSQLLVYGKQKATIDGVDLVVSKIKIGGRTAHYIPSIQRF